MTPTKPALFGTTDIYSIKPYVIGQHSSFVKPCGDVELRVYSSGKLEAAIHRGLTPYVVSIKCQLEDYDRWWLKLVPPERVFLSGNFFGEITIEKVHEATTAPWKRCYQALGIDWPGNETDLDSARLHLVERCGVINGASLHGHATN